MTLNLPFSPPTAASTASDIDREVAGRLGDVLRDRYVLEKCLGGGSLGTVFKALDRFRADLPEARQYVAIKLLHADSVGHAERLARFRCEFHCTQALAHQNIVQTYELDRDGGIDFYTMEYLEGELLSSVMARLRPLPMARPSAWAIIRDMGSALVHAHGRGVVHADLKPHNVMITHSGELRLLGFGGSQSAGERPPDEFTRRSNLPAGSTASYSSCEILAGRSADPRDDIYSLACLSYELLAGTHPFQRRRSTDARDLAIVATRPPELSRRQWHALAMGLSWHRAGRSIPAHAWLKKMNTGRFAVEQMPGPRELKPTPEHPRSATSLKAAGVFAVLVMCATLWVSFIRLSPGGGVSESDIGTAMAATKLPGQASPSATVSVAPEAQPPTNPTPAPPVLASLHPAPPRAPAAPITVSARNYRILPGEHFAEIRVLRNSRLGAEEKFVWWTEAASAKPGVDYVPQTKVTQSFPRGKRSASFFIKLVPNAVRAQREVFYIAIADPGRGLASGPIARAAVWLPTNQEPPVGTDRSRDVASVK